MFDESLDLSGVLHQLKRADESLTECIAPLWPGVALVAAWMEGKPRLLHLDAAPAEPGYYLLGTEESQARVVRPAEHEEIVRFRKFLPRATVYLLDDGFAFPASFAERLQGITAPRPIHFAEGEPLGKVQARFDGVNLYYDGSVEDASPLGNLFSGSSIFSGGELLNAPGTETAEDDARAALDSLQADPDLCIAYTLQAVLDAGHAELLAWSRDDSRIRLSWQRAGVEHTVLLDAAAAPVVMGISLAGARGFDAGKLTRLLVEHVLDPWRSSDVRA